MLRIPTIYPHVLGEILNELRDGIIWISADETTDDCGRYIVYLIVGILKLEPIWQLEKNSKRQILQRWSGNRNSVGILSQFDSCQVLVHLIPRLAQEVGSTFQNINELI